MAGKGSPRPKRSLPKITDVQKTKFGWAYVDSVRGKRDLVPTGSIFRVQHDQKLPFLPKDQDDFDQEATFVQQNQSFCAKGCLTKHKHLPKYKKVFVKFLGSKYQS